MAKGPEKAPKLGKNDGDGKGPKTPPFGKTGGKAVSKAGDKSKKGK